MIKKYDLAVKVGQYTTRTGETKNRYENIGAIMEGDNGQFMFLKRTFNPAGVNSDKESILVSMFVPRAKDGIDDTSKVKDATFSNPFDDSELF